MNLQLVAELIRLRYKLLWARTRTRNGRIALFIIGYLLFVLVAVLLSAGGFGAGMVAVRSGQAEKVAQIVLGSLFLQAVLGTVIMGFGMNATFSELELRRYPVGALERRLTRHLIGIVDPFWFLVLALDLGLAVGLYAMGAASFWLGVTAVLLLFVCNYLFARVCSVVLDRMMQHKSGSAMLLVLVVAFSGAGQIPLHLKHNPAASAAVLRVLAYTPPFGAAAAMVGQAFSPAKVLSGIAVILGWAFCLVAALTALGRRPQQRRKLETTAMKFSSPFDRPAAWFGAEDAPLVAHWLRFYVRNNRFRVVSIIVPPMLVFVTYSFGRAYGSLFAAALGTFPLITFMSRMTLTVNQFGYSGRGIRRYFLLPVDSAAVLRTGSYASMLLGACFIPLAAGAWALMAPGPFDARILLMLLSSALAGLFVLSGAGLWASVYGPSAGKYDQSVGNDLSLMGNLVIFGSLFCCLLAPHAIRSLVPGLVDPDHWRLAPIPPALGFLFFVFSMHATGNALHRRRERLAAVVEGRA
jgi:hypothetical protein